MHFSRSARSAVGVACSVLLGSLALTACGGSDSSSGGGGSSEPVEMWARASTASQSQVMVEAYNASHDNDVKLTIVPTENYLQKVGVAAGADELPCMLSSDVVYMPNFLAKNLFLDISERVNGLGFADSLAKGHMDLSSQDGKIYAVPHTIGMSAIFQNDLLLEKAGIDPDKPLTSLEQLADNAAKVADLGDDMSGLYYTGNNGGSIAFTHFPFIWASGGEPLSEDGMTSELDKSPSVEVFEAFNAMFKSGATPDSVRNETGATRNEVFGKGKVGYMLASNSVLETVPDTKSLKVGVQAIPGVTGGQSTFVGGDVLGISASCKQADAAWDFLSWSLSEEAQVGVYGKANQLTVRTDLAENEYSAKNPRVKELNVLVAEGRTPKALNFGQTFNDPNGPGLSAFRDALFGDDAKTALESSAAAVNSSLATR